MDAPRRLMRRFGDGVVMLTALALLCGALLFATVFVWHAVLAATTAGTHIVVSTWGAALFGLASAFVVATALMARREASPAPAGRWPLAVWLVAAAWLLVALVWATAGART